MIDTKSVFKIPFGLFVLTAKDGDKDTGCIINTAMLVTNEPQRISVAVNKKNFTHDMILKTGAFNVSVLTEKTPFTVFQQFGFQSGRDADKFAGWEDAARSENGIMYIPGTANALLSAKVVQTVDFATHTLFIGEVTEAKTLSDVPSATYDYYQTNIKPKPEAPKKKGWVCKICGYVYEGDPLPADFICPLCKHPASDFDPL